MLIFQASRTWDGIQTNTSAVLPKLEGSYFGQVMFYVARFCGDPRCTQSEIGSCFSQPRTCGLEERWLVGEDGTGDTCVFVSELINCILDRK